MILFSKSPSLSFLLLVLCYGFVLLYLNGNLLNESMRERIATAPVLAGRRTYKRRRHPDPEALPAPPFQSHYAVLIAR